ncbi:MAG TPA: DedA family protein [Vulgatibacter sp.]
MTEWLKETLLQVHPPLAYLLVFAFAFFEAPLLLGFVVPGELATILGGALVRFGNADLLTMVLAAAIGAAGGDSVGYWMGRWIGPWFLGTKLGKWLDRKQFKKARRYLKKRGAKAVLVGRFASGIRVVLPAVCGIAHMPYGKFVASNVVAASMWGAAMVAIGYVAGAAWDKASKFAGIGSLIVLVVIFAVLLALKVGRRVRAKRHPEPDDDEPDDDEPDDDEQDDDEQEDDERR